MADILDELARANNDLLSAQRALAKRNAELEVALAEVNDLLGMAAHDLRTPLQALAMTTQAVLENPDADRATLLRLVSMVRRSTATMTNIVENFLDYAAIERGALRFRMESANLRRPVENAAAIQAMVAERRDIELELSLATTPDMVFDVGKVEQVVANLLSNAIKYSPRGSRVEVYLLDQPETVRFEVRDQGPGIALGRQAELFAAFSTAGTETDEGHSTGLGLAIAKRLIEGHGGSVFVDSLPGRGSTFGFELPKQSAAQPCHG
jgi:signal transduction histidine kinase